MSFLSLPFDPDLNESWFKLWHVKTNLKDALGTGNRAASRRSGFKKSQIVKTSCSKFSFFSLVFQIFHCARPRDARSKSRQVKSCIRSRSRHWRVWKRGLQGVSVILSTPGTTETPNCITGTELFFLHGAPGMRFPRAWILRSGLPGKLFPHSFGSFSSTPGVATAGNFWSLKRYDALRNIAGSAIPP